MFFSAFVTRQHHPRCADHHANILDNAAWSWRRSKQRRRRKSDARKVRKRDKDKTNKFFDIFPSSDIWNRENGTPFVNKACSSREKRVELRLIEIRPKKELWCRDAPATRRLISSIRRPERISNVCTTTQWIQKPTTKTIWQLRVYRNFTNSRNKFTMFVWLRKNLSFCKNRFSSLDFQYPTTNLMDPSILRRSAGKGISSISLPSLNQTFELIRNFFTTELVGKPTSFYFQCLTFPAMF